LLLSAAMSVSSFRICLLLDEVQRSLHVKPRSPFDAVHVKPHLFTKVFAELHEKYTKPVTKRKSHEWNWYEISQFQSLIHIVMSSAINKRCGFIFTLRMLICICQKWNLKRLNTQCVTQCFWYNSHSRQTFCLPVSPVNM